MAKFLVKGRKFMLVGRRLALFTAGCIARCCQSGPPALFYRLRLCGQPISGVPQYIAVEVPFECGGCPLNAGRIVIYRGHCYVALGPDQCDHPLICADGKCEADKLLREMLEPTDLIVAAGDLICKPLSMTCQTVPCVPVVPGCCSSPLRSPFCGDGHTQIDCPMPKRFRVSRTGSYRIRSWVIDDPQGCGGYYQCENRFISFSVTAEFECEEGTGFTTATMRTLAGSVGVSGVVDPQTGLPSPCNGGRSFVYNPSMRGTVGTDLSFVPTSDSQYDLLGLIQCATGGFYCNGSHDIQGPNDPPNCRTITETCEGGRHIYTERGTCHFGTIDWTDYKDCYLRVLNKTSIGHYDICGNLPSWNDTAFDQTIISAVTACPIDQSEYVDPGQPSDDGLIFPRAGGNIRLNPNIRQIRQTTEDTFGRPTGGLF